MVTYESFWEVPPSLGTLEDWRTQGRTVPPGTPPDARVALPRSTTTPTKRGGQKARLYLIEHTRPIADLTETAKNQLRRAQHCTLCGQTRKNPLGKTMLPGRSGVCAVCEKSEHQKGHQ